MRYLPHTEEDIRQMLDAVGVKTLDDLFVEIPAAVRLNRPIVVVVHNLLEGTVDDSVS